MPLESRRRSEWVHSGLDKLEQRSCKATAERRKLLWERIADEKCLWEKDHGQPLGSPSIAVAPEI